MAAASLLCSAVVLALSVRQPWASLIASGAKTIETRTWYTHHRGPLLICASAGPPLGRFRPLCRPLPEPLPRGVALCVARLVECRPMTAADAEAAKLRLYPGALAWVLEEVRPIRRPWPVKGRCRLFHADVPAGALAGSGRGYQLS